MRIHYQARRCTRRSTGRTRSRTRRRVRRRTARTTSGCATGAARRSRRRSAVAVLRGPTSTAPRRWSGRSVSVAGDAVLSAGGAADDIDRSIVRSVTVPASGDRTLTFDTRYNIETGWDFGLVQVSTDAGSAGRALRTPTRPTSTTPPHWRRSSRSCPGSPATRTGHAETFDLSAYAGQTVLLRFRMMTDRFELGKRRRDRGRLVDRRRRGRRHARLGRHPDRLGTPQPRRSRATRCSSWPRGQGGKQTTLSQVSLAERQGVLANIKKLFAMR